MQEERRRGSEMELEADKGDFDAKDDPDIEVEAADDEEEMAPATNDAPLPPHSAQTRRASIAELRERLHKKIAMLHQKRTPNDTAGTTPSTKQELLEERRRQRGELRDQKRRERKEARRQVKVGASGAANEAGSSHSAGLLVDGSATLPSKASTEPEPEPKLSFSQMSFATNETPDLKRKNKYALPSDPKAALVALEARKKREEAKLKKQIESGRDEAFAREQMQEAERWGKAMAAAEGVRIRDNVGALKQTIKRREKSKAKSAKAWYANDCRG